MKLLIHRLGELCQMVKGTAPTLKTPPGSFPLVVTADFRRTADTWQLEGPAVCIPLVSSTGHGDAALHRVHYQEGKFALANLLVALLPKNPSVCCAKYLYYFLMARKDELLVPLMQGTANVSLKEQDIAGVEIPLPQLAEQRNIVAQIEELSAKVEEARALRQQAEEEAELLVPARAKIVLQETQKRHGSRSLLDVCDFEGGSQPPKSMFSHEPTPGYMRFLQIRDFSSDNHLTFIPESSRNSLVRKHEVLVGRYGASLGKILRGKEGAYNVAMCKAVPLTTELTHDFLAYSLAYGQFQDRLSEISRSAQAGFNKADLKDVKIPLPPPDEQKRIVAYLGAVQDKVTALKTLQAATSAELDALMPSILDKAFRGEL